MFRVIALPAPTEREKSQLYVQRYVPHFPAGGEVVIFDRSWYNQAGVERVMGFCTDEQTRRLESRINDPRKVWKLSDLDLRSYGRDGALPRSQKMDGTARGTTSGCR